MGILSRTSLQLMSFPAAANLAAQNIGINTANPVAKLTVIGSLVVGDNF